MVSVILLTSSAVKYVASLQVYPGWHCAADDVPLGMMLVSLPENIPGRSGVLCFGKCLHSTASMLDITIPCVALATSFVSSASAPSLLTLKDSITVSLCLVNLLAAAAIVGCIILD